MEINKIVIVGQQNLQNAMVEGYLNQNLTLPIQFNESLNWPTLNIEPHTVYLLDCFSLRAETIQNKMETVKNNRASVVLFNCEANTPHEDLVKWPTIVGVLNRAQGNLQIRRALDAIQQGELWLSRALTSRLLNSYRTPPVQSTMNLDDLTRREKQILEMTLDGLNNDEISRSLNLSINTVKTHLYNVFKKLNVSNRVQLLKWAHKHQTAAY